MRLAAYTARAPIGIRALASSSLCDVAPFPTVDAAQAGVAAFRHAGRRWQGSTHDVVTSLSVAEVVTCLRYCMAGARGLFWHPVCTRA